LASTICDGLACIIGEELSSVEFVRDYVQLRFDGPVLTVLTPPTMQVDGEVYPWARLGFRDALCAQIGHAVAHVSCYSDALAIEFNTGSVFRISLRDEDYTGPEALMFTAAGKYWVV